MSATSLSPRTENVSGWGMAVGGQALVVRPTSADGVRAALQLARSEGLKVALRGSGCSYGDAASGNGKLVVDLSQMNRILAWDPASGRVRAEAGTTLRQIWQHCLADGWWPPVVSGTMEPTLGGAVAMNIHGKNAFGVGPIGEHVRSLRVLTVDGSERTLTPEHDADLLHAIIGGLGELCVVLEVELQLKHIYSGFLDVHALAAPDLEEMFRIFDEWQDRSDYLVGWLDGFCGGKGLGRGLVHVAHQVKEGADPDPRRMLTVAAQSLPSRLFGILPKSWMWMLMKPFAHDLGMRLINVAKYWSGRLLEHDKRYRQTHAAFHFLLDYVPNWKFIYKPDGLIQHQIFVPKDKAREVFRQVLALEQARGLPTWLAVMKRHRPDPYLLTHGLDGYSLAQDFRVTKGNRERLWALCHEIDDIVVKAGGRFYFAKDATLRPASVAAAFPAENMKKFADVRKELDPEGLLATDLYDRAIAPVLDATKVAKG